ncbi:alpha-2-macroglobulin [uncultured Desulfovibrio sp.]|uniref:alpha-2-macroglobulin family protein n=2 Tax=uncultured Desulfovibrio sp. TaxID=167968 RepID=UPI00261E7339|nr:MG2 domain-containing protein [uncultured Desulfovibrio sp.]
MRQYPGSVSVPALALLVCLFLAVAAAPGAHAATAREPAYRAATLTANYPWQEGLDILLRPDESRCRAAYGGKWRVRCATALGRPGDTATGIRLSPEVPGHWQWRDSATLRFVPAEGAAIRPGTAYRADLEDLPLPPSVVLDKLRLSLTTPPLSVRLVGSHFWTDPAPRAGHRLSASLEFNYPVGAGAPDITLAAPAGARFGQPEMVWNQERDAVNLSWPVLRLPERGGEARITVGGLGQFGLDDGKPVVFPPSGQAKGTVFRQNIPGTDTLFHITAARVEEHLDEELDRGYVLQLEASLYARPEEVLRHLEVRELPIFASQEAARPCDWESAPAVPAAALERGRRLTPEALEKDDAPLAKLRFRLPAVTSGSYVLVTVGKGCASASGHTLERPWRKVLRAHPRDAALGFLQPGNVLPLSGKRLLDISATDLDAVRWRVQQTREPFLALLAAGSGAAFDAPLGRAGLEMDVVSSSAEGELPLAPAAPGEAQFTALDLGPVLDRRGADGSSLMRVQLIGVRNGKEVATVSRLVLATDLGLMVKRAPLGDFTCFVHSLSGGTAVDGAMVSILGTNGRPVAQGRTDGRGHVAFPSLSGLRREARPVAAVAESNGDLAWLPLEDATREAKYSEFPVGGRHSAPGGLIAYVFSQRGIYRPGETLHFGCITRRADFACVPADLPLRAEMRDPRGAVVLRRDFPAGEYGMALLDWMAPEGAASGTYTLDVRPAGSREVLGSAAVRVEEFQPETLRLHVGVPTRKGWLPVTDDTAAAVTVALRNLYGAPAAGRKVRARVALAPAEFRFTGYEGYVFTDAARFTGRPQERRLPEVVTGPDGTAAVPLPADMLGGASVRVAVAAEGFEADGGRATLGTGSFLASPLTRMVGYRPVGALTNLDFIPQGQRAELEFLAVDPELRRVSLEGLEFSVAARRYVTSLVSDGNGGYRYDEVPVDAASTTVRHAIPESGLRFSLPVDEAGEYLLTVRDASGAVLASVPYAVAGERPEAPDALPAAARLRLRLDRERYAAGESIALSLSLPYAGTGLITLEREGVAAFAWFEAPAGDRVERIVIPEGFEGRGYVNVSFTRSPDSPAIYMSPHCFAVAPFSAGISARDMDLRLSAPETVLPGTTLRVEARAGKKGKAVIFAVDEGVLQLTRSATPAPLAALLEDRALEVKTLQALDLLMPDHARLARRISAFGGGMAGAPFGARFPNPSKRRNEPPVATWSALVDVGPQARPVEIPLPAYYTGTLRIMAVGVADAAAGSAALTSVVTAPLVLTPRLPLAVSPGDVFEGALILANTSDRAAEVTLAARADDSLTFEEPLPERLTVAAGAETVVPFRMRALETPGAAEVHFSVYSGDTATTRSVSLSVRPASPLATTLQAGVLERSALLPEGRDVYAAGAASELAVSALPLPLARGFAAYLESWPYGCTEQLVSRAFAALLLRQYPPMSTGAGEGAATAGDPIGDAIGAIRSRSAGTGGNGVGLWPDAPADKLLTAYAVDFLLTLRETGATGTEDLLEPLCDAVERGCALNESTLAAARTAAYGIWVLTREGRITTQLLENLLMALEERQIPGWRSDITAVLVAASQRELHMRPTVELVSPTCAAEGWFDGYAQQALYMTVLARSFPHLCGPQEKAAFFAATEQALIRGSFATFSASQGIRALLALGGAAAPDMGATRLACVQGGEPGEMRAQGALLRLAVPLCRRYGVEMAPDAPPLYWQVATTGFGRTPPAEARSHGIEVSRVYLDAAGRPLQSVRQGEVVTVRITARAMEARLAECVISDLLPGGFEMVLAANGEGAPLPPGVRLADRREDRLLLFADLTSEPLVFTYRIRAVNRGAFAVPPIHGQAMYEQAKYGHGAAGAIEVRP